MIGDLPESLTLDGVDYPIRCDYRNILSIFEVFSAPELNDTEKWIVAFRMMFECFSDDDEVIEAIENGFPVEKAIKQINWFIAAGKPSGEELKFPIFDWAQDEQIIFSAINEVAKTEVREKEYMHWWTLLGYSNSASKDSNWLFVMAIRYKLGMSKRLEKHEEEFLRRNPKLVLIKPKLTEEEQKAEDDYQALLKEVLG